MATTLLDDVVGEGYEILEKYTGKDLEGTEYDVLFPDAHATPEGQQPKVVCDHYVTLTDGTGIVHLAPFGDDDARIFAKRAIGLQPNR